MVLMAMPQEMLNELKNDQLWSIVNCNDYKGLNDEFKGLLPARDRLFLDPENTSHDRALEEALGESTTPLDSYWCLIALIGFGMAQAYMTVAVLVMLLGYYLHNCEKSEQKYRADLDDNIHYFQLQQLRSMAADELIGRIRRQNPDCTEYKTLALRDAPLDAKPKPVSKASSAFAGFKVGVCFFGAYYLSSYWLFEAAGMTVAMGAMMTPVGLGIAISVAILLVLYCAYDNYKANKSASLIEFEKNKATTEVDKKRDECQQLLAIDSQKDRFFNRPREQVSSHDQAVQPKAANLS